MLATPLQLAHVAATIAMRGKRFEPRLVRAVRDSVDGRGAANCRRDRCPP